MIGHPSLNENIHAIFVCTGGISYDSKSCQFSGPLLWICPHQKEGGGEQFEVKNFDLPGGGGGG